jgi:hypothetical protein
MDKSNDRLIDSLTDEEAELLISHDDIISIKAYSAEIEAIKKLNPEFKDKTLRQLNEDDNFQKVLKEYRAKYPTPTILLEPEKIKEALKSKIPSSYYITNNKLSNEIIKDIVNKGEKAIAVLNVGKKNETYTYNSLSYDNEDVSITGRYEFTAYDRAIHNAVSSLYVAGNQMVTPAMVYRAVNGMKEAETVSPQSIEAVTNSLDKSRFMRLKVNFTEEAQLRGLKIEEGEIEGNLLSADKIKIKSGGSLTEAYKINRMPILYQYSQYTKQILSVPFDLLDTKKATRNTEEIIPIKEYLIRRIEMMKHEKNISNKIVYDTIFRKIGIEITSRNKTLVLRKAITAIMELWKKKKYIKDYKEYKEGTAFKGIEIIY